MTAIGDPFDAQVGSFHLWFSALEASLDEYLLEVLENKPELIKKNKTKAPRSLTSKVNAFRLFSTSKHEIEAIKHTRFAKWSEFDEQFEIALLIRNTLAHSQVIHVQTYPDVGLVMGRHRVEKGPPKQSSIVHRQEFMNQYSMECASEFIKNAIILVEVIICAVQWSFDGWSKRIGVPRGSVLAGKLDGEIRSNVTRLSKVKL